MFLLTEDNAASYLRDKNWPGAAQASAKSLGGGVSNTVLLVESPANRVVCKQALEKLRVEADWRSRPERTLREADALEAVAPLLPAGAVPRIHFIDRENCIYAMEAAPPGATDWKAALLRGVADPSVASAAGRTLGAMIRNTWRNPDWEQRFGDQTVFDELRLDPYYRFTAARHPDCAAHFDALIESCRTRRVSLVHGDWSPKNLLLTPAGVMAIDFEVVHYGNPCFDTGFLLCHLLMKSIHRPVHSGAYEQCAQAFWHALALEHEIPWIVPGTIAHLGGLLLARADGKSIVEYLSPDGRETLRRLAKRIIFEPPSSIPQLWSCL
ncbi:MAG: phosphotransferase [Acidobacteria bacterium]|nr:phosphotransferase [Acidobacteriota bacterium]